MAEIFAIFHWPPDAVDGLSIHDLVMWRNEAVAIHNRMNAVKED